MVAWAKCYIIGQRKGMGRMNRKERRAGAKQGTSPGDMAAKMQQAVQWHQAGQLDRADGAYAQILRAQPAHGDALYLRGVIAAQRQDFKTAADLIQRAIAVNPLAPGYHSHLGNALRGLGRFDDAAAACRQALLLQPDYPEAHYNLGNALLAMGQEQAALDHFQRALALQPQMGAAHLQAGRAWHLLGRLDQAMGHYHQAHQIQPQDAQPKLLMAAALNDLAKQHLDGGRWAQAEHCSQQALTLDGALAPAHHNLGLARQAMGRWREAAGHMERAIHLNPGLAPAHNSLGATWQLLGQDGAALACYAQAVALQPDYAEAHTNMAQMLLAQGEWAAGWREYEWRWQSGDLRPYRQDFAQPQWRGERGDGETLLIHAEQGFGDSLQFCRYAPLAAQRGWRVVMQVPQPLVRLMTALPGVAQVVATGQPLPDVHKHCPMLSLPLAFGTEVTTLPDTVPYLAAPAEDQAFFRSRVTGSGLRVGVVWAGRSRRDTPHWAAVDARRSLDPHLLAPLVAVPGIQFFSLQKEGAAAGLIDLMSHVTDFAGTAGLIAQLDLVIAVDTAVAHLAAAMGKPVWLLNRFDSCWRWLRDRNDSPWYPTLRQYRQQAPGQWEPVIAQVAADLRRSGTGGP